MNFLAANVQDQPVYQTIRPIKPNDEIIVFFDHVIDETKADDTIEEIDVVGVADDCRETSNIFFNINFILRNFLNYSPVFIHYARSNRLNLV